jgi:hypothetical protein
MSSERITMFKYLAERVPADVHFTLNKYDSYRKARNTEELESQIKHFVRNYGEKGLNSLAEIHPDRELLEGICHSCSSKDKEIHSLTMNNDLHSNFLGQQQSAYFNAMGDSENRVVNKMAINSIIIGGFVLMGVALMLKK